MNGSIWIAFVGAKAVIAVTPGPAVMMVMAHGLAPGGRSHCAALGIVLINALFFLLAAMGVGAVLSVSPGWFVVLKWIAASYLVVVGAAMLLRRNDAEPSEAASTRSAWRCCRMGMLLQLANPNALLFFLAILPQFVDPRGPVALQIGILGVTGLALDCLVLLLYGTFAAKLSSIATAQRIRVFANRSAGLLLVGTGVLTLVR